MRLLPLLNDAAPAPHQHTQTHPPLPAAAASLHEAHAFQLLPYRWAPRLFPGSHCHEKCYSRYLSPHPWIQRHRYRYTEISRDVFYVWEWPYECTAQTGTAFSGKRTFQTLIAAAGFYSKVAGTTRSPRPAHGNARFTATPPTARLPLILGLRQTQCGVTAGRGKPPPPPPATVLPLGLPRTGRVAGPRPYPVAGGTQQTGSPSWHGSSPVLASQAVTSRRRGTALPASLGPLGTPHHGRNDPPFSGSDRGAFCATDLTAA